MAIKAGVTMTPDQIDDAVRESRRDLADVRKVIRKRDGTDVSSVANSQATRLRNLALAAHSSKRTSILMLASDWARMLPK